MPYVKADPDRRKKGELKKTKWIKVRASLAEFEIIHRLAEKAGVSMSEYVRIKALKE